MCYLKVTSRRSQAAGRITRLAAGLEGNNELSFIRYQKVHDLPNTWLIFQLQAGFGVKENYSESD